MSQDVSSVASVNNLGLQVRESTAVDALARDAVAWLRALAPDPFGLPVIFVPTAGVQRWLSQRIATASTEGICAGIRFERLGRLEPLVSGLDQADDPWSRQRLVWRVLDLAQGDDPALEPLRHHLGASEQRYANAARIAALFERYARLRPDLVERWSAGDDGDLGFDAWQPHAWRVLRASLPGDDPVERRAALLARLRAGEPALDAPAFGVFAPRFLTAADAEVVGALAAGSPVRAWVKVDGPLDEPHPLAARLGRRARETRVLLRAQASEVEVLDGTTRPTTWLGTIQHQVESGAAGAAGRATAAVDGSLQVWSSHGLHRQVEVLRELLTGAFADDPSLEPRDVVVACPDPEALAPHVSALFSRGNEGADGHPARQLRLQVGELGASEANELYALVREVVELDAGRATAVQLLALAAHPFVARRFGFDADDLDELAKLVRAANVRWGINDAHRAAFGLDRARQGTWQHGVQRLLLGEALGEGALASVGTVFPVDAVDSSALARVGALAELVSRLTRLARGPVEASASGWVAHLRAIVDELADVPFEQGWQLAQYWSVLDLIARRSAEAPARLSSADVLALLSDEFASRTVRPSFGNGSLVVCSLTALAQVPHKVVALVGLDEGSFPRRGLPDGDDLLAASPRAGDPEAGRDDRQAILDALLAAQERLIVVYQGSSTHTREPRPAPAGVLDVVEQAAVTAGLDPREVVHHAPLQPFSPRLFDAGRPLSFDHAGLAGARALIGPQRAARDRYRVGMLPPDDVASLELTALQRFLAHPADYFLRERASLTLRDDEAMPVELPLELDGLGRWQVGQRILTLLQEGHDLDAICRAEWLRGDLPPGELGRGVLDSAAASAHAIAQAAGGFLAQERDFVGIDLDVEGVRLTGRVVTHGGSIVATTFSKLKAKQTAHAWVEMLAATVARGRPVSAALFGSRSQQRLTAPDPEEAARLLSDLVAVALDGRCRPLPMPLATSHLWATERARGRDPQASRWSLVAAWENDRDAAWKAVWHGDPWDAPICGEPWAQPGEPTQLGSLAALVWAPILLAEQGGHR